MKYFILSTLILLPTVFYILLDNTVLPLVLQGKPLCQVYQESYQCSLFGFGCPSDSICYTEDQFNKMVNDVLFVWGCVIGMVIHELYSHKKETLLDVFKMFFVGLLIVIANVIKKNKN